MVKVRGVVIEITDNDVDGHAHVEGRQTPISGHYVEQVLLSVLKVQ